MNLAGSRVLSAALKQQARQKSNGKGTTSKASKEGGSGLGKRKRPESESDGVPVGDKKSQPEAVAS